MRIPTVAWTERHLEELDRVFPELLDNSNTNDLILNTGKRTVVDYVRQQVMKNRVLHD